MRRWQHLLLVSFFGIGAAFRAEGQESDTDRKLRFYGHLTPTVLFVDDGVSNYTGLVDNSNSGGRIGFWYESDLGGTQLKLNGELSLGARQSAAVSQSFEPSLFEWGNNSVRKLEVIVGNRSFGQLSVGQGSMGSDGVSESDLSGTVLANYVGIADMAGGFFFRTDTDALSTVQIEDAFPTYEGGRSIRLRYDTREIGTSRLGLVKFSLSLGKEAQEKNVTLNDVLSDVGVFYRNEVGQFALAGSAGTSIVETTAGNAKQISGSFSVLHQPTGFSVTIASGSREKEGRYIYTKFGLRPKWFEFGDTALSVDYYQSDGVLGDGTQAKSYGLGVVQHVEKINTDIFLGVRKHGYDSGGILQYQDLYSVYFGARWVFRRLEKRTIFEDLWQRN